MGNNTLAQIDSQIGSLIYFQAIASSTYFPLNFKQRNICRI